MISEREFDFQIPVKGGGCVVSHLEQTGAHNDILVSTVGQQGGGGARAEGTKLHHVDVTLTRHHVRGAAARILLHGVNHGRQMRGHPQSVV